MKARCSRRELLHHTGATALGLMGSLRSLAVDRGKDRLKTDPSIERVVEELRTSIPGRMERAKVPGLSIALIRDARVVWSQGFGVKSTATREPVTADTVFEAASLSKPAFAYAFLKLCETRQIGLDRSLAEFLPEPFVPDEPRLKQITTCRVLSHTSGLPHGRPAGSPIRLRFTPGERFAYSASGFYYLQTVAEQLTKQPLAPFMAARLLTPLGMKDSSFGWHDRYEKEAARGHWQDGKPGLSGNGQYVSDPTAKAGGIWQSPTMELCR